MRGGQINLIGIHFCGIIYKTVMHEKKERERKEGPEENVCYTDFV